MKMNQKGFVNIILVVVIVVLVGAVGYFVVVKKSEPIAQQPTSTPATSQTKSPTPTPKDETANWKTYSNNRYSYTILYPSSWFVDMTYSEGNFTQRGPDNESMGGDTTWSNYQNPGQYNPGTLPSGFAAVFLLIYKTDTSTTLDSFINLKHFSYSKKENVNINGASGIRLTTGGEGSKIVLLKVGDKVFDFSYSRGSTKSAS